MLSFLAGLAGHSAAPPPATETSPLQGFPLLDLPFEARALIASCLPFPIALALSHTCRELHDQNVWVEVARTHGLPPVPTELRRDPRASLRHVRVEAARRACVGASTFSIAWGDSPQYWARDVPTEGALHGAAAVLRLVWWFDVRAPALELRGSGTHHVFFRAKTLRAAHGWGSLHRAVELVGEPADADVDVEAAPHRFETRALAEATWVWVWVGAVHISARGTIPTVSVSAHVYDHDATLKENVAFSHAQSARDGELSVAQLEAVRVGRAGRAPFEPQRSAASGSGLVAAWAARGERGKRGE